LLRLCRRKKTLATDGEIDFGAYTREQLDNAVSRMDRYRYPINYRNLVAEYQRRRVDERQAVELTAKSGSVAPPDNMISVPRVIAVTFEPNAGLSKWLRPSRNDFHLVASGTVQVDGAMVRNHCRLNARRTSSRSSRAMLSSSGR
jgi:hypothetical protein